MSKSNTKALDHAPKIVFAHGVAVRILGCTCGWLTPVGATDSDDTYSMHVALHVAVTQ